MSHAGDASPTQSNEPSCIAFEDHRRVASGSKLEVALVLHGLVNRDSYGTIVVFDDRTSRIVELDLRGSRHEVEKRCREEMAFEAESRAEEESAQPDSSETGAKRGRGRPKLGVVGREVTLLPRHWKWLGEQRGGASVTLRRLVDQARKASLGEDRKRRARESAYRFASTMAGNLAGFEEATRALFADDREKFRLRIESWPEDVREHASRLADRAFLGADAESDSGGNDP